LAAWGFIIGSVQNNHCLSTKGNTPTLNRIGVFRRSWTYLLANCESSTNSGEKDGIQLIISSIYRESLLQYHWITRKSNSKSGLITLGFHSGLLSFFKQWIWVRAVCSESCTYGSGGGSPI